MFTGIVEEIGKVKKIVPSGDGYSITINSNTVIEDSKIGDSISINGACQTVTDIGTDYFTVFMSKITGKLTTLGKFKSNQEVNLERAMQTGDRFGGHFVQGHVDGMGIIKSINSDASGIEFTINTSSDILEYIVERGSISIDGISLTVVSLKDDEFKIYIIPETIKVTILKDLKTGDNVNIETDIIAKYIEKMVLKRSNVNKSNNDKDENLKKILLEEGYF
jgi:riboflavin synthase